MDPTDIAVKLQEVSDRSVRNEGRIKKLEADNETLHSLSTNMAVMVNEMKNISTGMKNLTEKVNTIEDKPAKRWESLVDKALFAAVGAFLAWIASGAPGIH